MTTLTMQDAFRGAVKAYPQPYRQGKSTWAMVDAYAESGMREHEGKFILQEQRDGCRQPFNHWGFATGTPTPASPQTAADVQARRLVSFEQRMDDEDNAPARIGPEM